ncbi:MAG: hypothetical protein RM368_38740, partial [Nostoc sp. DedSLP03]|uniref:hypothetical protein n=1 Tax=Nostoc sp. DedSLP03 TaxID=3075400 RepID=UPI002AD4BF3D
DWEWLIRGSASSQTLSQRLNECIPSRRLGTRKVLVRFVQFKPERGDDWQWLSNPQRVEFAL